MGGCQNYGPFLGTLNIRCRIIIGIQKGAIILRTTHMGCSHQDWSGFHTSSTPPPFRAWVEEDTVIGRAVVQL